MCLSTLFLPPQKQDTQELIYAIADDWISFPRKLRNHIKQIEHAQPSGHVTYRYQPEEAAVYHQKDNEVFVVESEKIEKLYKMTQLSIMRNLPCALPVSCVIWGLIKHCEIWEQKMGISCVSLTLNLSLLKVE